MVLSCQPPIRKRKFKPYELNPREYRQIYVEHKLYSNPLQQTYYAAYLIDNWEFIPY